ncbi:ParA family protein [Paenibacillus sp. Y412MC10]|uniref:ParA family protein n=1 Tax=Geobacillus sp. (strain Y412MC10) TaxID=481743 RepID=UPI0011AAB0DC|nr:AAA family ATPase [Paenibacillus sp. Y412MC10]
MRTIFWGNYKGGVGKTTSTFQVAAHFASNGKKVLLIDLDPQCSLSNICCVDLNLNLDEITVDRTFNFLLELYMREINSDKKFDLSLLTGNSGSLSTPFVRNSIHKFSNRVYKENLFFIPSSLSYTNCRINELAQYMSENIYNVFLVKQFIDTLKIIANEDDEYNFDFVFFDCPPTTNLLTQSVFLASDYYIIPTICDEMSTKGVPDYIVEIEKTYSKFSMNDRIRGILINKVFPQKSKFIGVFETLYKNRAGTPKNYPIIASLDSNICKITDVTSVLSDNTYAGYRYNSSNNVGLISTNNIFNESIDHRDARKTGNSIPRDMANAQINYEYYNLAMAIMKMLR